LGSRAVIQSLLSGIEMGTVENWKLRVVRCVVNVTPVFRATGAWITHISADTRLVKLKLPLKLKTKNPMGTMCGGNMYSAVHGIYLVMLTKNLGNDYTCVDKYSTIKFLKPAKGTLFTQFELSDAEINAIKSSVEIHEKVDREYLVKLNDTDGVTCAEVTCTVNIRRKRERK
jgi:acyl-coenzyme A thioesterase PaaI-like protein